MSEDPNENEWWRKVSVEDLAEAAQERHDAAKLIEMGNRTGDSLTKSVGQARLRIVEGRATPEDLELLRKMK